ncbi:MAG: UvrABC system protein A [Bacteroidia bacterium]|nr:UvrABC system protein A [Bacteroidia bacterium]
MPVVKDIERLSPKEYIIIKGARVHNLKNISLAIPHKKLVVITGLSGSGKSSLAFDTLYAEGQRRYVESLSAYARQFLGKIDKPEVDYIKGIAPAIAIEQKVNTVNPRSTVGTSTEIYDYIKLLFARIGKTYSPVSGKIVKRETTTDVVDYVLSLPAETKVMLIAPVKVKDKKKFTEQVETLIRQGFTRVKSGDEIIRLEEYANNKTKIETINLLIDRFAVNTSDEELSSRIADSVETAYFEGGGECIIEQLDEGKKSTPKSFTNRFEADGISFEEPSVNLFAFNNPYGACKKCEGFGSIIGIDEDLVVPDKSKSVYDEAIVCWRGESMGEWKDYFIKKAYKYDFPIHKPYFELTEEQKDLLWNGNKDLEGIYAFFRYLESKSYKIQYRVMLSRYRGRTLCPDCKGTRLRKDANYVKIGGKSVSELMLMPVNELLPFFSELKLNEHDTTVAKRLMKEIVSRLQFLEDVGLGYLTLNRLSSTLSGGESQRINLASSLGSSLVGSLYILDEPSIGLHPRDTERLIKILKSLRDIGNTVIVVEHDEEIMRASDLLIDIGPEAGTGGGNVVFIGDQKDILKEEKSITARYLTEKERIELPAKRRVSKSVITLKGVRENNLKNIDVSFPLNTLCVITGVSGSGKSSLLRSVLYPALKKIFAGVAGKSGQFDKLEGDVHKIKAVEFVDQNPIGRSSRSNPVTYIKAYDEIRTLYSNQQLAKFRGYGPGFFSFNVAGGRCDVCEGEGEVLIEMQFMADIHLPCDNCHGKRFKQDILEIVFNGKNVADILDMTVDEAMEFFLKHNTKIAEQIRPLQDVGLGYVKLGQSSSTLSGGEAQRIKLASFIGKGKNADKTLFIFDEPTTGLHFHDIKKLLKAFEVLLQNGHSLVIIEHNPDVIKCADYVIDLGPEGGKQGGNLVFAGTPEELVKCKGSYTGLALKEKI